MNGPFNAPPRPVKPVRAISRCVYSARLPFSPRPVSSRKHEHREENRESFSLSLSSKTRKLLVKNLSMVRAEIIARRRLLSSIRPDRKEGLYRRKSRCQLESKREGSQVSPANLPVPRQDNGGSCLGRFRGRECLTVLTERRRERLALETWIERQISWERMGDDRRTSHSCLSGIWRSLKGKEEEYCIFFLFDEHYLKRKF